MDRSESQTQKEKKMEAFVSKGLKVLLIFTVVVLVGLGIAWNL